MLVWPNSFTTFANMKRTYDCSSHIWTKIEMVSKLLSISYGNLIKLRFFILGKVDLEELISAFMDLGIEMDKSEAKNLLLRYVFEIIFNLNSVVCEWLSATIS